MPLLVALLRCYTQGKAWPIGVEIGKALRRQWYPKANPLMVSRLIRRLHLFLLAWVA
jgi:hypothetical protein